jgi:hypothetical protein
MLRITSSNLIALAAVSLFSLVGGHSAHAAYCTAAISAVKVIIPGPMPSYVHFDFNGDFHADNPGPSGLVNFGYRLSGSPIQNVGSYPAIVGTGNYVAKFTNSGNLTIVGTSGDLILNNRIFTGSMYSGQQTILATASDSCPIPQ